MVKKMMASPREPKEWSLLKTSTKTYRLYVRLIVVVIPLLAQVFVNISCKYSKSNKYYY